MIGNLNQRRLEELILLANFLNSTDPRAMELIIKPTEACNFKCTFCSSTNITDDKKVELDHGYIFDFLDRFPNTSTIIVNGGDPLMMSPDYYWKIIEFLDDRQYKTSISFTTNLWAFYKKPSMWVDLFKHPRMGITTSFNYGDTRRITDTRIFTEDIFWKVSDKFTEHVGYRPDFISVITDENEDTALDNVRLAKRMDVECKLNYAMASGVQGKPYLLSKIYAKYIQVYNEGLMPWEFNTKQMVLRLKDYHTMCPQHRKCDENIRTMNPSGDYYSCGSIADDRTHPINFTREIYGKEFFTPLQADTNLVSMKEECLTCPMFKICNGCRKTIKDLKDHNLVEEHCTIMKTLASDILEINFAGVKDEPIN